MLGIVLVNYKTIDPTIDYVRKELSKLTTPFKLVIVNNACEDESNRALTEGTGGEFLDTPEANFNPTNQTFVIAEKENLGYAKGNNLGVQFLRNHFPIDYVLITNNDLELLQADIIDVLIEKCKANPDIGMIGPKVIGRDGNNQSPHRFLPLFRCKILPLLLYPLYRILARWGYCTELVSDAQEGYYYRIMGCFCLSPLDAFEKVGGFDPETFLYAEELILAERFKREGYRMYYTDAVSVIHHHGQTTKQFFRRTQTNIQTYQSLRHYYRRYLGASKFSLGLFSLARQTHRWIYSPFVSVAKWLRKCLSKRN